MVVNMNVPFNTVLKASQREQKSIFISAGMPTLFYSRIISRYPISPGGPVWTNNTS